MKNRSYKLFDIVLVFMLLTGCVNASEGTSQTSGTVSQPVTSESDAPQIPAADYGGYKMTFLTWISTDQLYSSTFDFLGEKENGELINDAVYKRNLAVEEKYNIDIDFEEVSYDKYVTHVQNSVKADDAAFDVITSGMSHTLGLAAEGFLHEIKSLPYIEQTKPWWNSNLLEETSIAGKNYFLVGDINMQTWTQNALVYFNKKVAQNMSIENLYNLVRDGKWTFDKFAEIIKSTYQDLNGNTEYDKDDLYGCVSSSFGVPCLIYGMGYRFIEKDENDIPYISFNEKFYTYFTKIVELCNDKTFLYTDTPQYTAQRATLTWESFTGGRSLFMIEKFDVYSRLRAMEQDFGLLPMPKADELQSDYLTWTHSTNGSTIAIPTTNNELDRTSKILEDMAYYSSLYVRPAYYEYVLSRKLVRDEESADMLDIIINNIIYDLSQLTNVELGNDLRTFVNQNNSGIASGIEKNMNVYNEKLNKLVESLKGASL